MVTYGGNRPTVNDNEVLTAQDFNDATRFWVTDELPDNGEDGDVVFVIGDSPVGDSGELPGLGGWATIEEVSGNPTRYEYNDGTTDWVAFEWKDVGTIKATGLVDVLLVGGGGVSPANGGPSSNWGKAGSGGGEVIVGVQNLNGLCSLFVQKKNPSGVGDFANPTSITGPDGFAICTANRGGNTMGLGSHGFQGTSTNEPSAALRTYSGGGATQDAPNVSTGGAGRTVAFFSTTPVEYGRGGIFTNAGYIPPDNSGGGAVWPNAASGILGIRVPVEYDDTKGQGSIPASVRAAVDEAVDQAKETVKQTIKRNRRNK